MTRKVTWEQVEAIRKRYREGFTPNPNSIRAIARDYDLSEAAVRNIISGRTWKKKAKSKASEKGDGQ
jgi:hypothetical protein